MTSPYCQPPSKEPNCLFLALVSLTFVNALHHLDLMSTSNLYSQNLYTNLDML